MKEYLIHSIHSLLCAIDNPPEEMTYEAMEELLSKIIASSQIEECHQKLWEHRKNKQLMTWEQALKIINETIKN